MKLRFSLVIFLVLFLAACFEYDAVVHVNPDGSGRAQFAYRVPVGLLEKSDLEGKVPLTEQDVDARYRMRAGITQYKSEVRDLGDFREIRIDVEFDHVDSLTERGNTFSYTLEDGYQVFRVRIDRMSQAAPQYANADPNRIREKMTRGVMDKYKIRYKVFLPHKVDQSNAQIVEWNAATWEIPLSAFITPEKQVIVLEAKSRVGFWDRIKWRVGGLFS
jgi:hypothetical protein